MQRTHEIKRLDSGGGADVRETCHIKCSNNPFLCPGSPYSCVVAAGDGAGKIVCVCGLRMLVRCRGKLQASSYLGALGTFP